MQDWSMIPLHIRCTQRNRIDPRYPRDDARWWQLEETKRGMTLGVGALTSGKTDQQQQLLELIKERGSVTSDDIRPALGWGYSTTQSVIMGLTHHYPVYEEKEGKLVRYCLLV